LVLVEPHLLVRKLSAIQVVSHRSLIVLWAAVAAQFMRSMVLMAALVAVLESATV